MKISLFSKFHKNRYDYRWIMVFLILWDAIILIRCFKDRERYLNVSDPGHFTLEIVAAFVITVLVLCFLVFLQEKGFKSVKEKIKTDSYNDEKTGMAKQRFLSNMTHDIRTPMNSIIGVSELMLKNDMPESTRQEILTIKSQAYDLLGIIDDVLMYSKLDEGKLKLTKEDFDLSDFIKRYVDSVSFQIAEKKLKMRVKIDRNMPRIVSGDSAIILQVFTRLMFISLSLTDNGRIMFDISSESLDDGRVRFNLSFSDTGRGLSEADLDAIYGAYETYDSRQNPNLKGVGLKFSVCRELLKLMDGNLEIKSIEGVGLESRLSFVLDVVDPSPMTKVESDKIFNVLIYITDDRDLSLWKDIMESFEIIPDYAYSVFAFDNSITNKKYDFIFVPSELYENVSSIIIKYGMEDSTYVVSDVMESYGDFDKCRIIKQPVSSIGVAEVLNKQWNPENFLSRIDKAEYDGSKARILVVDDNMVNLKVAQGIFKHYKIDVDIAVSGQECLTKMARVNYHLVLMDMIMPEMSGLETLLKIRESDDENIKNVPVVALTANKGSNIRDEIIAQGFVEYIAKPIKQKYLLKILSDILPASVFKMVKSDKDKDKDKVDLLSEENILDVNKGLSALEYNEKSYNVILNTYYSEGMRKLKELDDLLEAGNLTMFTTDVHGIKSSSASVGAMTVSKMFKELEFAGKEGNTVLIKEHYAPYIEAFKKILEDVKAYLESNNAFTYVEEKTIEDLSALPLEELTRDVVSDLKEKIDAMVLRDSDKAVKALKGRNFGEEFNGILSKLFEAYSMYDFHTVKEEINVLLEKI